MRDTGAKITVSRVGSGFVAGGLALMHACASYEPLPPATAPTLAPDISHISVDTSQLQLPILDKHVFDPSDGLDMTEVAMLAVANNPDLKVARVQRNVADAQLFAAGLLPDPVLSLGVDNPSNGGPQTPTAFDVGLSYAVRDLVTRPAAVASAAAARRQVDLELLWREWQVAQQARLLFLRRATLHTRCALLRQYTQRFADRYAVAEQAIVQGQLTRQQGAVLFAALLDASEQLYELEQQELEVKQEFNALLGLAPDAMLALVDPHKPQVMSGVEVQALLAQLNERRPDLLALQAGYQSQEQRYRQAVLAQFPELVVGVKRARDTDGIYTTGVGITLTLPFLNRNRGPIAVEKAVREQLHAEYQARLDSASTAVEELLAQHSLVTRQYNALQPPLQALQQAVANARNAYDNGRLDVLMYTKLEADWLAREQRRLALEQSLAELALGVETLLFCRC